MNDRPVWDEGGWHGFPRLESASTADVCVVGLGGSGIRAIQSAVRRGLDVVGVDVGAVAGGAAGRNGGFLLAGMAKFYHQGRSAYGAARASRFYAATVDELELFYSEGRSRRTGSLRIAGDEAEMADIAAERDALRADGFSVEWYEGPEGSGILIPDNGVCNPLARVRDLALEVAAEGARLHEWSRVVSVDPGVVRCEGGVVAAGRILVAIDGGLELILPQLRSRVRTASLQMLATAPEMSLTLERPVYTNFGYDYHQQLPDGRIALGGRRDRHADRSWTSEAGVIAEIQADLDASLARIGVTARVTHRWGGLVSFTSDGVPVMEEVMPGVVAIGGYSGHGNVVGSIYGREAMRLLLDDAPIVAPL